MKISFSNHIFAPWNMEEVFLRAHTFGYDGIEWVTTDGAPVSAELEPQLRQMIIENARQAGVEIAAIRPPLLLDASSTHRELDIVNGMTTYLQLAKEMHIHRVIVVPAARPGDLTSLLTTLSTEAESRNVRLEVATRGLLASPTEAVALFQRLGNAHCWLDWETDAVHQTGADATQALASLKDRIDYVTVSDLKRTSDGWQPTPLGTGELPLQGILRWLNSIGYRGFVNVGFVSDQVLKKGEAEAYLTHAIQALRTFLQQMGIDQKQSIERA